MENKPYKTIGRWEIYNVTTPEILNYRLRGQRKKSFCNKIWNEITMEKSMKKRSKAELYLIIFMAILTSGIAIFSSIKLGIIIYLFVVKFPRYSYLRFMLEEFFCWLVCFTFASRSLLFWFRDLIGRTAFMVFVFRLKLSVISVFKQKLPRKLTSSHIGTPSKKVDSTFFIQAASQFEPGVILAFSFSENSPELIS